MHRKFRTRSRSIALASLAVLAGFSVTVADARTRKPDNLVPVGEPVSCIQLSQIRGSHVLDDKTIDFDVGSRTVYRNVLPHSCPGLGFEERFAFKTSMSQLCSVDIIYVLQSFGGGLSTGAGCGLGQFQKMEKPK